MLSSSVVTTSTTTTLTRSALLVAAPPLRRTVPRTQDSKPVCVVCNRCTNRKSNPLQLPVPATWNTIVKKINEWKDLNGPYSHLHHEVTTDSICFIHKVCRLNVTGSRLENAKKAQNKIPKNFETSPNTTTLSGTPCSPVKRTFSRLTGQQQHSCVFCIKSLKGRYSRSKITRSKQQVPCHRIETLNSWSSFRQAVKYVKDRVKKNRLEALITFCENDGGIKKAAALDIRYHKDCWKQYCRPLWREKEISKESSNKMKRMQFVISAKQEAFSRLCTSLTEAMRSRKEVFTLRDILSDYEEIQRTMNLTENEIRTTVNDSVALKALRKELENHFGNDIGFKSRYRRNESPIVFLPEHGGLYVESAVNSWGMNMTVLIQNVAKQLHYLYRNEPGLSWPCNIDDLITRTIPDDIFNLIALLVNPTAKILNGRATVTERLSPAVHFLSDCIMNLITNKRQQSQVMLSMTSHNLTGSKDLIQTLSKLRIGINYDDVLDLQAAWAYSAYSNSVSESSQASCPPSVLSSVPAVVVLDNDDFREDGLTGAETSHYTNVILAQVPRKELKSCTNYPSISLSGSQLIIPSASERKKIMAATIKKKFMKPNMPRSEPKAVHVDVQLSVLDSHRITAHAFVQLILSEDNIPSFTGFHCNLEDVNIKANVINIRSYPQPPCKEVVEDVLCWCQNVAQQKQMPIIAVAADQAVYKYVEELLWENETKFSRVKGVLGGFHTEMSYLNALGKRYAGSGLEELAVICGAVSAGSANRALRGKHYSRGMRVHKLMSNALIRMLIERYMAVNPGVVDTLKPLLNTKSDEQHEEFVQSSAFTELVNNMFDEIRKSNSDMAIFWLSYIIDVEILFEHYHCLRSGNKFEEYIDSCRRMLPLLAAYGNVNYVRYLSIFFWRMSTLSNEEKTALSSVYTVSLTGRNYSGLSPDQVIEMTMNKQSKNRRGNSWIGYTKNLPMIATSILARPIVLLLREYMQKMVNLHKPSYPHPELRPSRRRKDRSVVDSAVEALYEWEADPWDFSNPILRSLSSAQPATMETSRSLLRAHDEGNNITEEFLNRLTSGVASIYAPIRKNKTKTFGDNKPVPNKSEICNKAERQAMKQVIVLLTTSPGCTVTLDELLKHRVTELSYSLFNSDHGMVKTVKSTFRKVLTLQPTKTNVLNYHAVIDMGMIWNKINCQGTWGDFAINMLQYILNRHADSMVIHCINDIYTDSFLKKSVKLHEQIRRSKSCSFVSNMYPVYDHKIPTGKAWRDFLSKPSNKFRLQQFLLKCWKTCSLDKQVFFTFNEDCFHLNSDKIDVVFSAPNQCEADSRAIFHSSKIHEKWPSADIVLDFEDTDVWILSAYTSHITGINLFIYSKKTGENPVFFNCRDMMPDAYTASAALGVYTFTGVDTVESFFGVGKVSVWRQIKKKTNNTFMPLMAQLGTIATISEEVMRELERFTIKCIYNDPVSSSLGAARALKWRKSKQDNTVRLPPDWDSFQQHCLRAHLQAYEWRHACSLSHLNPETFGWHEIDNILQPVTHTLPALPDHLNRSLPNLDAAEEDTLSDDDESTVSTSDDDTDDVLDSEDDDDANQRAD